MKQKQAFIFLGNFKDIFNSLTIPKNNFQHVEQTIRNHQ